MSIKNVLAVLESEVPHLGPISKLILIVIADQGSDEGDNAWPSVARLAARVGVSERAIQKHLRQLESQGFVEVERQAGGTRNTRDDARPNLYRLRMDLIQKERDAWNGVNEVHPPGEQGSPRGVNEVHQGGERGAPEPVLQPVLEPKEDDELTLIAAPERPQPTRNQLADKITKDYIGRHPDENFHAVRAFVSRLLIAYPVDEIETAIKIHEAYDGGILTHWKLRKIIEAQPAREHARMFDENGEFRA